MSEGIAGDLSPDAQVVKPGLGCPQAGLDISEAFPVGKLGKDRSPGIHVLPPHSLMRETGTSGK